MEVRRALQYEEHDASYDSYSALLQTAQGAPSLIMSGGAVGATDLLSGAAGECFETDMAGPAAQLAKEVRLFWRIPAPTNISRMRMVQSTTTLCC